MPDLDNYTLQEYVLSPLYAFADFNDIYDDTEGFSDNPEYIKLKNKELFLLREITRDKLFAINPTIYHFLQAFSELSNLKTVIEKFAKEAGCTPETITTYLKDFLIRMKKRRILVSEEKQKNLQNMLEHMETQERKAVLEAGHKVGEFTVDSVLSLRSETQLYLMKLGEDTAAKYVIKITFYSQELPKKIRQQLQQRFNKEFKLMEELGEHKSICKLITFQETKNHSYAILEYIKGDSLRKYIKRDGGVTLEQKLDLIKEILQVIAFVQDKGVLHGDLHSSNFLVNEEGRIKLIDFGLSNRKEPDSDEILRNGGKTDFIPPERVSLNSFKFLEQRADATSEVFQLGIMAFYILYERMPFRGFTWREMATNIKTVNPVLEGTTPKNEVIPEQLITIITKAIDKLPENRYEKARDMLAAFEHSILQKSLPINEQME